MQYNPKLKRVMAEIKAILIKEDIAGVVVLHIADLETNPGRIEGFTEFLFHITPSYSSAHFERELFKVKINKKHFGGDAKKRDKIVAATANMLHHLSISVGQQAMLAILASDTLDKQVNSEHDNDISATSHEMQNN